MSKFQCVECGEPYEPKRSRQGRRFCSPACHRRWANRRNIRGALLYDFVMTTRYDRQHGDEARDVLQNLCRAFRDADKATREGRQSWRPFADAKRDVPLAFGQNGDGR